MSDSESTASSEHDVNVEVADAGSQPFFPMQCGKVRKGGFIVIDGHACKVAEISTSKTGKHGHAKAAIVGIDIFDNSKLQIVCPTSHNVEVPFVHRDEYQLTDIEDGYASLMNQDSGETRTDLKIPEGDLMTRITDAFNAGDMDVIITVQRAMNRELIIDFKTI